MKRETITAIAVFFAILLFTFVAGYYVATKSQHTVVCDTTTYVDTIPYYQPVAKDSMVVRYETRVLPVSSRENREAQDTISKEIGVTTFVTSDERDSAAVVLPIIQKRYEGEDYRAYVSGYEPSLDSIFVFPKTTIIRERSYKPPNKWHIGITGGYGYGFKSKQAEPYIGIGITYSLISF